MGVEGKVKDKGATPADEGGMSRPGEEGRWGRLSSTCAVPGLVVSSVRGGVLSNADEGAVGLGMLVLMTKGPNSGLSSNTS